MADLAIVIPAYKIKYFKEVLNSFANQTCKEFTLYIGIDGSIDDFKALVDLYATNIKIVYKYFPDNLGGINLVSQWERCIDMVQKEQWIWLFSDDDLVDESCVELFYQTKKLQKNADLFHFNVSIINETNEIMESDFHDYPQYLNVKNFLLGILQQKYHCTVVEFIFRKTVFFNRGRFQQFDLAWCSDISTWIKIGDINGVLSIPNAVVYWRASELNISCNNDIETLKREFKAQVDFSKWICDFLPRSSIDLQLSELKGHLTFWFIQNVKDRVLHLTSKICSESIHNFYKNLYNSAPPKNIFFSISIFKIYKVALFSQNNLRHKIKKFVLNDNRV